MVHQSPFPNSSLRQIRWPGANLYRNPFGELTRQERAQLAVVDLGSVLQVLCRSDATAERLRTDGQLPTDGPLAPEFCSHQAYQLIGDCGRGKTTQMLAFGQRIPAAAYVYLPEDAPCPSIPDAELLLIDEAQRLPPPVRRRIFQSGRPMVLATHTDLSRALRQSGYQVTTERIGLTLSPERLVEILNRRIESSRRETDQPTPRVTEPIAEELIRRFGTNIRAIEGYLYDLVQSQVDDHGEMRFID